MDSDDFKYILVFFFIRNNLDIGKERWLVEKIVIWCREDVLDFKDKMSILD